MFFRNQIIFSNFQINSQIKKIIFFQIYIIILLFHTCLTV